MRPSLLSRKTPPERLTILLKKIAGIPETTLEDDKADVEIVSGGRRRLPDGNLARDISTTTRRFFFHPNA